MGNRGRLISGLTIEEWQEKVPVIRDILSLRETAWINQDRRPFREAARNCELGMDDVLEAASRLRRFAPYFMRAFPATAGTGGLIESPLREAPCMKAALERESGCAIPGRLFIKLDSHLAVSGSIKARGGIYEVLKLAEDTAIREGLLDEAQAFSGVVDYRCFDSVRFREIFSKYSVAVGSTGNLGLSIGIMGARLGFKVTVHMSADARQWKKDMLRGLGVNVIEYGSDYSEAVRQGRIQAAGDPRCHFVDDENSRTLFLGYAAAALRLRDQLGASGIAVDREHPLLVYLPCGVGGGPGGVAFGLKMVFGDAVHCFFAEPVHSCCMLLGMATGEDSRVSVQDFGIDNVTVADGLAVGRASGFVGRLMRPFMSGCYTVSDERMLHLLHVLADSEGLYLEPSALAGMYGPVLMSRADGRADGQAEALSGTTVPGLGEVPGWEEVSGRAEAPGVATVPGLEKAPGWEEVSGRAEAPGGVMVPGLEKAPGGMGGHGYTEASGRGKFPSQSGDPEPGETYVSVLAEVPISAPGTSAIRPSFGKYIASEGLAGMMADAVHLVWATGGSMVPEEEMRRYYEMGKA